MNILFRQLPDIHTQADLERHALRAYGRFGMLPDGSLWVGDSLSSHPREVSVGWYWGITYEDDLILSSRNVVKEVELLQGEGNVIVRHLIHELLVRKIIPRQQGVGYGL